MEYRFLETKDMVQVEDLWDYCFEKREEPFFQYYFHEYNGLKNKVYGALDNQGKLACMLHLNPYQVKINGQWVRLPYLVGVATAKVHRGHHLMGEVLRRLLEEHSMQTLPFVFLMPINAGIYLPYGFAFTHYRHEYHLDAQKLGNLPISPCKALEVGLDAQMLAPLYEAFTTSYNAVNTRAADDWEKVLTVAAQENYTAVVLQQDGKNAGYAIYKVEQEKEHSKIEIFELLAEDALVKNALLQYLSAKGQKATLHWLAPYEDKTYLDLRDQEDYGKLAPFMMFRCTNVAKALQLCVNKQAKDGTLVLQVTDKLLPRNNKTWQITKNGQQIEVKSIESEDMDSTVTAGFLSFDIATLTQMLLGTYTARELSEAGKVIAAKDEALKLLTAWLPKRPTWINEYF